MKNKIIHIGYPKTASTWLKRSFFPLSNQYELIEEEVVVNKIIRPNALAFNPIQTKTFFDLNFQDNIIISESMLSGSLLMTGNNGVYTKEICYRLKEIFSDAKIAIFIRNQPDIIASSYLEYIRKGGSYSIDRYLWRNINIPLEFRLEFFEYDLIIDLYKRTFGEGNIHVFLYEDFLINPNKFITKIIEDLNLDIQIEDVDFTVKNLALQKKLYSILKFINQFSRKGVFLKRYFIDLPYPKKITTGLFNKLNNLKIFGQRPETVRVLGLKNLSIITDYYKKSNRKLNEKVKLKNLKELGYPI